MPVGIIATLKVQDGKQSEFETAFAKLQEIVRGEEPGCTLYALCQDKEDATTYRVMEQYADEDARKAHARSDEARAAMGALAPCLAGAPEMVEVNVIG